MLSTRIAALGLSVAALLSLAPSRTNAQQASPATASAATETPAAKPATTPPLRVPNYFGQLGLSPEQKTSIYEVVAKRRTRIDELKKELAEENRRLLTECEALLNDTQKQSLQARRKAAVDTAKARAAARALKAKEATEVKDEKKSD